MSWKRRSGAVIACGLAMLMLVGCVPPVRGILGIERTSDGFAVVAATCKGFTLSVAQLLDLSRTNDKREYVTVREWSLQPGTGELSRTEDMTSDEVFNILGDGEFRLWGSDGGLVGSVVLGPDFGNAELLGLAEGDVLEVSGDDLETTVLRGIEEMTGSLGGLACGS